MSASVHHSHCRAIAQAHARTLYTEYTLYRQGCHQGVWYRTGYCGEVRPRLLAWPLPGWRRWETEQPPALPALSVPGKCRKGSGTSETPPPSRSPEAVQQGAGTAGERAQLPPRQRWAVPTALRRARRKCRTLLPRAKVPLGLLPEQECIRLPEPS